MKAFEELTPEELTILHRHFTGYRDNHCNGHARMCAKEYYSKYGLDSYPAVPKHNIAQIIIPTTDWENTPLNTIKAGSGVVAVPVNDGFVKVYYEGDVYGSAYGSGMSFADKVKIAAGRLFQSYPTTAFTYIQAEALHRCSTVVGSIDDAYEITINDEQKLAAWMQ